MYINSEEAVVRLKSGKVVAIPTETVYGLAASLAHPEAIAHIFSLKGRPAANPLIIHLHSADDLMDYAESLPPEAKRLAHQFWPGPLTLILPAKTDVIPAIVRAGLPTAGFRVPSHPLARQILKETGPLVMPSANLSGKPSATSAQHVFEDFGAQLPILDGGACPQGLESTILAYQDGLWSVARLGSIPPEAFLPILGYIPAIIDLSAKTEAIICPGQHFRHYAPKAKLLCFPHQINETKFILGFRERSYPADKHVIIMGSLTNPASVAEGLYAALRQLDSQGAASAFVDMAFPSEGLWLTISERLRRAAE